MSESDEQGPLGPFDAAERYRALEYLILDETLVDPTDAKDRIIEYLNDAYRDGKEESRASLAAVTRERDAAIATLDDEEAAHQDTLRLWQLAKTERDAAMAALRGLYKLGPRPWIKDASVTWPEWDAAYAAADAVINATTADQGKPIEGEK